MTSTSGSTSGRGKTVIVWRRGKEVEAAGRDLCDVLVAGYEDQQRDVG